MGVSCEWGLVGRGVGEKKRICEVAKSFHKMLKYFNRRL